MNEHITTSSLLADLEKQLADAMSDSSAIAPVNLDDLKAKIAAMKSNAGAQPVVQPVHDEHTAKAE